MRAYQYVTEQRFGKKLGNHLRGTVISSLSESNNIPLEACWQVPLLGMRLTRYQIRFG